MGYLELQLLNYYRSQPIHSLTAQETDELLFLEVKLGLEHWTNPESAYLASLLPLAGNAPASAPP